jgi:pyruvate/2-oxoglutarate dehydrogenase complex dihydrolipoamide acyltransferase (E2) component
LLKAVARRGHPGQLQDDDNLGDQGFWVLGDGSPTWSCREITVIKAHDNKQQTTEQQSNRATEQQSNKATKQQNNNNVAASTALRRDGRQHRAALSRVTNCGGRTHASGQVNVCARLSVAGWSSTIRAGGGGRVRGAARLPFVGSSVLVA